MVAGNTVIHGATVDDWRELAAHNGWPHETTEQLAKFIDAFREWWQTSCKNPAYGAELRRERRKQLRKAEELIDTFERIGRDMLKCQTSKELNELIESAEYIGNRLSRIADVMTGFTSFRFNIEDA